MSESVPLTSSVKNTTTLGLDLGKHHIRIGLLNDTGELTHFQRIPYQIISTETANEGEHVLEQMLAATRQLIDEHLQGQAPAAIGLALPGLIHHPSQRIVKLPYIDSLAELDVRAALARTFNTTVKLANNAQAATFAEMQRGRAQGAADWMYIHLGANVSAGLVLGGQLQYGKSGYSGALGEMTIDPEQTGDLVTLESMVTAENIVRRTQNRLQRDNTSSLSRLSLLGGYSYNDIIEAAESGDELARLMLQRTGKFIGLAICEVISLLNLSLVAVGGAPDARKYLVPAIAEETQLHTHPALFDDCQIVAADLGAEATVIGAALLAKN